MRRQRAGPATRAARAGLPRPRGGGEDMVAPPALAAVQGFTDLDDLDAVMEEGRGGYRRYGNQSVDLLQDALADLESPEGAAPAICRVAASGQAALLLALSVLVTPRRRRVVVLRPCYGATESLIAGPLAALGIEMSVVDLPPPGDVDIQLDGLATVLDDRVACVIGETITNPLMGLLDVPRFTALCSQAGVASVIDSTLATPFMLRPFEHGADVVIHSLSKQLSGHSDVIGGAVLIRADHSAADWLSAHSTLIGAVMGPFDAWLSLRGLRTAGLRAERGAANASALAGLAGDHAAVAAVHYPGRRSSREEALAARLLPRGRGSMLGLDLGDRRAAGRFLAAIPEVRLAPSLGDVATSASHPGLTSHRGLSPQRRAALGIGDGLVRLSVGIEPFEDLAAEVKAALDAVGTRMASNAETATRSTGS